MDADDDSPRERRGKNDIERDEQTYVSLPALPVLPPPISWTFSCALACVQSKSCLRASEDPRPGDTCTLRACPGFRGDGELPPCHVAFGQALHSRGCDLGTLAEQEGLFCYLWRTRPLVHCPSRSLWLGCLLSFATRSKAFGMLRYASGTCLVSALAFLTCNASVMLGYTGSLVYRRDLESRGDAPNGVRCPSRCPIMNRVRS